ncbi:hypothetical protein SAMN05421748_1631, partial [Paractinoplanes atraurantiacus]
AGRAVPGGGARSAEGCGTWGTKRGRRDARCGVMRCRTWGRGLSLGARGAGRGARGAGRGARCAGCEMRGVRCEAWDAGREAWALVRGTTRGRWPEGRDTRRGARGLISGARNACARCGPRGPSWAAGTRRALRCAVRREARAWRGTGAKGELEVGNAGPAVRGGSVVGAGGAGGRSLRGLWLVDDRVGAGGRGWRCGGGRVGGAVDKGGSGLLGGLSWGTAAQPGGASQA